MQVALELGLPFIETTGWLSEANGNCASNDYTHPLAFAPGTDEGHRKAGRLLAQALGTLGVPILPL
ncbi:hypothetical protein [Deinococcus sp.]|uniref:hypothetical protein n=1 Tax=Deinococcus sp. TaxID=47478 RepID=UPI0025BFF7E5|nr:hypothetical protein [Deinococcus sp.]